MGRESELVDWGASSDFYGEEAVGGRWEKVEK